MDSCQVSSRETVKWDFPAPPTLPPCAGAHPGSSRHTHVNTDAVPREHMAEKARPPGGSQSRGERYIQINMFTMAGALRGKQNPSLWSLGRAATLPDSTGSKSQGSSTGITYLAGLNSENTKRNVMKSMTNTSTRSQLEVSMKTCTDEVSFSISEITGLEGAHVLSAVNCSHPWGLDEGHLCTKAVKSTPFLRNQDVLC